MNTHAIPALKRKRALIAGQIISLKSKIKAHEKELASLDATIVLFDPAYRKGSIKPIRTHKRAKMFKHGQLGRLIISAIRKADKPLTTGDVVRAVMVAAGVPEATYPIMHSTVRSGLEYLGRRGRILRIGERGAAMWGILPKQLK